MYEVIVTFSNFMKRLNSAYFLLPKDKKSRRNEQLEVFNSRLVDPKIPFATISMQMFDTV